MITRIQDEHYVNLIELAWIFIKREFYTTMEFMCLYDQEERSWNCRPVIWYIAATIITALFFFGIFPEIQSILFSVILSGAFTRILQVSLWK
jgi:uncharacterized membrane protein